MDNKRRRRRIRRNTCRKRRRKKQLEKTQKRNNKKIKHRFGRKKKKNWDEEDDEGRKREMTSQCSPKEKKRSLEGKKFKGETKGLGDVWKHRRFFWSPGGGGEEERNICRGGNIFFRGSVWTLSLSLYLYLSLLVFVGNGGCIVSEVAMKTLSLFSGVGLVSPPFLHDEVRLVPLSPSITHTLPLRMPESWG